MTEGSANESSTSEDATGAVERATARPSFIRQLLPLFLLIVIFIAAGAGALLIRWGSKSTLSSRMFASTNQFDEWSGIVAGVLALSVAVASSTWPPFLRVAKEAGRLPVISAISVYVLISTSVILGPFLVANGSVSFELSHFYLRMSILTVLILVAAAGSFCGLELIWYTQNAQIEGSGSSPGETVRSILSARKDLQRFFTGATVLITGGIIIIGGLRSALNTDESENSPLNIASVPVGGFLLYGAFFALLLAFVLIPSYGAWQARIASFRDQLYPVPEDGGFSKDWFQDRSNLEDLLAMRLGLPGRFLAVVGILAPLIGSILSATISALR
jgi:hypothetical protein